MNRIIILCKEILNFQTKKETLILWLCLKVMSNFVFVVRFLYTIRWCHDKATGSWGPKQLAFFGYDVGSIHTYANNIFVQR
jgi:hypothetical protein